MSGCEKLKSLWRLSPKARRCSFCREREYLTGQLAVGIMRATEAHETDVAENV